MEKTYLFATEGVCAGAIEIKIQEETVTSVRFLGGCNGNTSGIGILVAGQSVDEIITKLKDIRCGRRATSCPDQLATALMQIKSGELAEVVAEPEKTENI